MACVLMYSEEMHTVRVQEKNPDLLLKNPDLLIRNLDLLKNVGISNKTGDGPDGCNEPG